jgi:hypothetical protein
MRPTVFNDQYIVLDPDGDPIFKTVESDLQIALSLHFADTMPSSTKEAAIKAGFKLIKCDLVSNKLSNAKRIKNKSDYYAHIRRKNAKRPQRSCCII